ncbi:hypothetical protein CCP2SC5_420007 [Azospirillaceae bacterium]
MHTSTTPSHATHATSLYDAVQFSPLDSLAFDLDRLIRAASTIAGEGVFTQKPITRGEPVAPMFQGRKVHRQEYDRIDWAKYQGRIMQTDDDWFLEGIGGIEDFINHSCDPNIGFAPAGTYFFALRDIRAEEEILFHYSTCENHADWRLPCACGGVFCREEIVGFCNLPLPEKKRLLPISLPYLRRRYFSITPVA